uniref:Uncharacterized protein n=1 Tax=Oryzias sinensis TaxID=183150 RepID=A0A8C8DIW9_9TELE
ICTITTFCTKPLPTAGESSPPLLKFFLLFRVGTEEVQNRNELIGAVTTRMLAVESREEEAQKELSTARQQLCGFSLQILLLKFQEKNQSLSSTVTALSTQVGSLQAREEELTSMLRLKEKDATEAAAQILSLSGRLRDVEALLAESRSQESRLLRDVDDHKRRSKEQQAVQSSTQREEIIRLKQELQLLHRDVALSEGDSWKDELLDLCRSKQERIMAELHCLRCPASGHRAASSFLIPVSEGKFWFSSIFPACRFCCPTLCHGQRRLKVSSTHFGWLRYCFDFILNFLKKEVNVVQKFQLKSSIIIP